MSKPAFKDLTSRASAVSRIRPVALTQRYLGDGWSSAIRRNVGLRVISLLLALGLWLFVNAGQHVSQQAFTVPISFRGLPPHFVVGRLHPDSVYIQVSGPGTLLSLIQPNRLALRLDLSGVSVGQSSFKIGPENFNVPRQTTVTSISPSQIVLEIDKIVTRDVPVRLVTSGAVADGYQVSSKTVNPRSVRIRGPSKVLGHIDQVETEPLDLTGATADLSRIAPLILPEGATRVDPSEVAVNLSVSEVVADREFLAVPIQVHNSGYPAIVLPGHVNLKVRGPVLTLARISLADTVSIDADGMMPGSYTVPVQLTLPEGIELVHQSAERVRLSLFRRKLGRQG
jgi:YbbR domain-containing protein